MKYKTAEAESSRNSADVQSSILDDVLNDHESRTPHRRNSTMFSKKSGRLVSLEENTEASDLLTIKAPNGQIEMSIRLTSNGPVVTLSGVALNIQAVKDVSIACENLAVATKGDCTFTNGGDVRLDADGEMNLNSQASISLVSDSIELKTHRGNIDIQSPDIVDIKGRLIGLNRK